MSARRDNPDVFYTERRDPSDIRDCPSAYDAEYDPVLISIIDEVVRDFAKTPYEHIVLRKVFRLAYSAGRLAGVREAKEGAA